MFDVDVDGWIAQNAGRPPEELVREVIQNALDTEANVQISANTRNRTVTVRDFGGGYNKLSDAYTIYGGDKGSDPTKRGRYGRGIKEMVAGAENVKVITTCGGVEFDVVNRERIDLGKSTETGTKVEITNTKWSKEDFDSIKEFVFSLWPPEGQVIRTDLAGGSFEEIAEWPVDKEFTARLDTVKVENGVMQTTRRATTVQVRRADGRHGRMYEMGIPVNMDEEMPYYVNVQQKIPMAEQRNEAEAQYAKKLRVLVLNNVVDELSDNELRAEWVQTAMDHFYVDDYVLEQYVERIVKDGRKKGVAVASSEAHYNDRAENAGYQVVHPNKMSNGAAKAVKYAAPTADQIAAEMYEAREEKVTPTPEEREVIHKAEEIAEELGYPELQFEMWEMESDVNGNIDNADHDRNGVIRLNRSARDWGVWNAQNIGTIVHEISHEHGQGHDRAFLYGMQKNFAELLEARW